jgi:hypothetical protein
MQTLFFANFRPLSILSSVNKENKTKQKTKTTHNQSKLCNIHLASAVQCLLVLFMVYFPLEDNSDLIIIDLHKRGRFLKIDQFLTVFALPQGHHTGTYPPCPKYSFIPNMKRIGMISAVIEKVKYDQSTD